MPVLDEDIDLLDLLLKDIDTCTEEKISKDIVIDTPVNYDEKFIVMDKNDNFQIINIDSEEDMNFGVDLINCRLTKGNDITIKGNKVRGSTIIFSKNKSNYKCYQHGDFWVSTKVDRIYPDDGVYFVRINEPLMGYVLYFNINKKEFEIYKADEFTEHDQIPNFLAIATNGDLHVNQVPDEVKLISAVSDNIWGEIILNEKLKLDKSGHYSANLPKKKFISNDVRIVQQIDKFNFTGKISKIGKTHVLYKNNFSGHITFTDSGFLIREF